MSEHITDNHQSWLVCKALIALLIGGVLGFSIGNGTTQTPENPSECVSVTDCYTTEAIETTEVTTSDVTESENMYYDCPLSHDLQDYIRELCEKNGIPMSLVIAIIDVESSFRANAVSSTNDYGLMQINKCNHKWLSEHHGITDILDPYQNVYSGITLFVQNYKGNLSKALMVYNLGAAKASRLWNEGTYETSYSRKVLSTMEVYENEI